MNYEIQSRQALKKYFSFKKKILIFLKAKKKNKIYRQVN